MTEYICPHCRKPIYDDEALLCLYCGESLNRDIGFMGKIKYTKPRIIVMAVVLAVVASFILLVVAFL